MLKLEPPDQTNKFYESHVALLLDSYQRLLKQPLLGTVDGQDRVRQLLDADFALLSHNADSDPSFNYANRTALELFEMPWDELVGMPSRFSTEPVNRQERDRLLVEAGNAKYIDNYSGIRITKTGKRFLIQRALVWNVYDSQLRYYGQAACFSNWTWLSPT